MQEIIDIEMYAKEGKTPPKGKKYRIKVDGVHFEVPQTLTGRQILELANKKPVERFQLNQKVKGGGVKKIGYDEVVDFSVPGIEKFMTLPLDQTEG